MIFIDDQELTLNKDVMAYNEPARSRKQYIILYTVCNSM